MARRGRASSLHRQSIASTRRRFSRRRTASQPAASVHMRRAIMLFAAAARALCPRVNPQPTRRAVVRAAKSKVNKPRYATGKAKSSVSRRRPRRAVLRQCAHSAERPARHDEALRRPGHRDVVRRHGLQIAAIVRSDGTILGESVARASTRSTRSTAGSCPALAKEAHELAIDAVVDEALKQAHSR